MWTTQTNEILTLHGLHLTKHLWTGPLKLWVFSPVWNHQNWNISPTNTKNPQSFSCLIVFQLQVRCVTCLSLSTWTDHTLTLHVCDQSVCSWSRCVRSFLYQYHLPRCCSAGSHWSPSSCSGTTEMGQSYTRRHKTRADLNMPIHSCFDIRFLQTRLKNILFCVKLEKKNHSC